MCLRLRAPQVSILYHCVGFAVNSLARIDNIRIKNFILSIKSKYEISFNYEIENVKSKCEQNTNEQQK